MTMESDENSKGSQRILSYSNEPILSAKELIDIYNQSLDKKTNCRSQKADTDSIEFDTGSKLNNPSGSLSEINRTQSRLKNLLHQVSFPKVAQKGQLSEAVWDDFLMKAKVTKSCGKHWNVMGHLHENNLYIYIEEALFLLECNSLELVYKNIAMSLQQAFQLLDSEKSDCSLENYLTYSKLARLGYKIRRHISDSIPSSNQNICDEKLSIKSGSFLIKDTEQLIANSKANGNSLRKKSLFNQLESSDTVNTSSESIQICKHLVNQLIEQAINVSASRAQFEQQILLIDKSQKIIEGTNSDKYFESIVTSNNEADMTSDVSNHTNDSKSAEEIVIISDKEIGGTKSLSMLPNFYNRSKINLTVPPLELLPNRTWPNKKVYTIDILRSKRLQDNSSNKDGHDYMNLEGESSQAVLDNDIEIMHVLPSGSTDSFKTNEKLHENDHLKNGSENITASTKTNVVLKQPHLEAVDNHDKIISPFNYPNSPDEKSSDNSCETIDIHPAYQSRGYYPSQIILHSIMQIEDSPQKKRRRKDIERKNRNQTKQLGHQEKEIDLCFSPNKRLPISNSKQCLPCDADTLNWLSQRNPGSSTVIMQTSENFNNDFISDPYCKDENMQQHNWSFRSKVK